MPERAIKRGLRVRAFAVANNFGNPSQLRSHNFIEMRAGLWHQPLCRVFFLAVAVIIIIITIVITHPGVVTVRGPGWYPETITLQTGWSFLSATARRIANSGRAIKTQLRNTQI